MGSFLRVARPLCTARGQLLLSITTMLALGCTGAEPFRSHLISDGGGGLDASGGSTNPGSGGTTDPGSGGTIDPGTGGADVDGATTGTGGAASGGAGGTVMGSGGASGSGGVSGSGGKMGTGGASGSGGASGTGGASGSGGAGGPCVGVAAWSAANVTKYVPGNKVVDAKPTRLFRCKAYPEGAWCQQTPYEPGDPSDYWRDAWDDLGLCNN